MSKLKLLALALVVFGLGYTLGQGHKPFDFNGDGQLNTKDFDYIHKRLTEGYNKSTKA